MLPQCFLAAVEFQLHIPGFRYEVQKPGLGERFRLDLHESLKFVVENPPGYSIRRGPYRAVLLAKFPYVVWYAVEGSDIVVYRIRHGRQRPLRKSRTVEDSFQPSRQDRQLIGRRCSFLVALVSSGFAGAAKLTGYAQVLFRGCVPPKHLRAARVPGYK